MQDLKRIDKSCKVFVICMKILIFVVVTNIKNVINQKEKTFNNKKGKIKGGYLKI